MPLGVQISDAVSITEEYVKATFKFKNPDGRLWQSVTMRNPGVRPNLHYDYTASNGVTYKPHPNGWVCDLDRMKKLDAEGRLHYPATRATLFDSRCTSMSQRVFNCRISGKTSPRFLPKPKNGWDIPRRNPRRCLRVLSQRATSSELGDVVLDPFCGCGTTVAVAERLGRRWIGIDITHLAIGLIKHRLQNQFGSAIRVSLAQPA